MPLIIISTLIVALAGIHLSDATNDYIETEVFHVGMIAKAMYTAPSTERTYINLIDASGGEVLHMDYRVEWDIDPSTGEPWKDVLVLNSRASGEGWGTQVVLNDFYFTPGTKMLICAKAEEGHFAISVNGKQVATYDHRFPVDSVKRISFTTEGDSALELLGVSFDHEKVH